ncbi:MAG TPA: hypothetical protein DHW31_04990 [Bacteroides graminisolvens]|jgi:hypothetical protein|uniref:Uncharacterized protein n=1 Tax=Bacteroides graminisolvens TaxID=477666 RepID=A0A3D2SE58_9BACE|nr:hypothetical protein [Bacteroides graminisolvens]
MTDSAIMLKIWNFANVLRDDGLAMAIIWNCNTLPKIIPLVEAINSLLCRYVNVMGYNKKTETTY